MDVLVLGDYRLIDVMLASARVELAIVQEEVAGARVAALRLKLPPDINLNSIRQMQVRAAGLLG